uniref:Genome polyprotein n=1 Tax=Bactrocera tryoni iflavirus 1 TaxID=2795009 RepID=A0A8A6RED0_9VIRU|nr:polyprotein [Bactrocera tryoni iflavirus 1]
MAFNTEVMFATPLSAAERNWDDIDDWQSDPEVYVTQTEKICNNVVDQLRLKSRRRELLFTSANEPKFITRFDRAQYKKDLKHHMKHHFSIKSAIKLLDEFERTGQLTQQSHVYLKHLILVRKYNLARNIDWANYPMILHNHRGNNYIYKFIRFVYNYQRHTSMRKMQKRRDILLRRLEIAASNRFYYLDDEDVIEDGYCNIELDENVIIVKSCKRKPRKHIWDDLSSLLNDNDARYSEPVITHDTYLLNKLHKIISGLENLRRKVMYRVNRTFDEIGREPIEEIEMEPIGIQPEMMEPEQPIQQQDAGPVVLNALQQDKVDVAVVEDNNLFWIDNSTSDQIINIQHASSMEVMAKQFKWSSDNVSNYNIFNMDLPFDVLNQHPDHPAAMLFNQYSYWNGDINIRIHINTTPFHVGKLIFSWYYSQKFDKNNQSRNNIASSVLLPHVCYDASIGDDVIFHIPFKNYRSMLCTKKKQFDSLYMYLGTLRCHVFNPLVLTTGTVVDGYIHVSFVNNHFTGISPRITVQPEMLSIDKMVKTVEKTLTIVDRVSNLDKPSQVAPPVMYTPQFTDSFATGTGDINNVHALRLNPTGLTQHPSGSSTSVSETMIYDYVRRWGFLRTIVWDTSMVTGKNVYRMPATPELAYNQYYPVNYKLDNKNVSAFVLPPLSVIAGINAYNRGSIEYKLEFINSKYHTGALVISFTPVQSGVSFTQALQSYNSTLDLGNTKSYIFKIPYINERPYNPRYNREISNNVDPLLAPIGEINVFILNELRAVTGTSDKVYVNIYIRAGDDFEFAVPVSPLYTINMDTIHNNPKDFVHADTITNNIGLATWRYMNKIADKAVVGKYSTGDDSILQMYGMKYFAVYQKDWPAGIKADPIICKYIRADGTTSNTIVSCTFQWCARFIVNGDKNEYNYVIFFADQAHALEYVAAHYSKYSSSNQYPDSPTIKEWNTLYPTQTTFYLTCDDKYVAYNGTAEQCRYKFVYSPLPQNEVDEVFVDPTTSKLASLTSGYRMFGEKFQDLKDYCRRYQPYASFKLTINKSIEAMVARIPLTPIGLDISNSVNSSLLSIIKEGIIPYIVSSYRFYRGGLRFKIIVSNFNGINKEAGNAVFYIQHKPDVILSTRDIKIFSISSSSRSALFQTGYAYSALSTSVNNSLTIEIPCYIPTNLLMLQKPNFDALSEILHYTLGVLDIYVKRPTSTESGDYLLDIHYSFADDMDMSCFVGVPPVTSVADPVLMDDKTFELVQPEMGDEQPSTSKQTEGAQVSKKEAKEEGILDKYVRNPIKNTCNKYLMDKACETVRKTLDLQKKDDNVEDTFWQIVKEALSKFGDENKHVIVSIVSNIMHLFLHPDISTLATVLITILAHIGLESYAYIGKFKEWLAKLFGFRVQPEADDAGDIKTETSPMDDVKSSIISSIVEMSASAFGKGKDFISNLSLPDFSSKFFTNIRFGALTVNACVTMIKNMCEFVPKIFTWLGKIINPKAWYRWFFFNESKFIKKWVRDVEWMTDPNNRVAVLSQVKYNYQIQLLVIIGRDLVSKNLKLTNDNNFKYITDMNTKLNKLYDEVALVNIGNGNIGIEPFCFCLHGTSQIGKTYITKALAAHCLSAIKYQTDNEIFYTRPLTTKHWDGVQNEPVCIYDDFAQVKTDQSISDVIGEFILLKSKATFTPPRAHLNDKGRKYSPLIVALTMNESHPKFDSVFADNNAWQNRRDVLVHVNFTPPADYPHATKVQDLPESIIEKFEHVSFSIHRYVNSGVNNDVDEKISVMVPQEEDGKFVIFNNNYVMVSKINLSINQIKWYLASIFKEKYAKMHREYLKDLALAKSFYPKANETFEVNLREYINFVKNNRRAMNAQEQFTIKQAEKMSGTIKCDKCNESANCMCDLNVFDVNYVSGNVQPEMDDLTAMQKFLANFEHAKTNKSSLFDELAAVDVLLKQHYPLVDQFLGQRSADRITFMRWVTRNCLDNEKMQLIAHFLRKPCLHLWLIIKPDLSYFSIDIDGNDFWLMYRNHEVRADKYDDCCGKTEYFDKKKYNAKIHLLYTELGLSIKLPESLTNKFECSVEAFEYSERYLNKLHKNREEFYNNIEKQINPETWLGKVGSVIKKLAKPLLYILGLTLGVLGMYQGYTMYKDYSDKTKLTKEYLESRKIIDADVLKKHAITDECVKGICQFCKVAPQMAYTHQQVEATKKKVSVSPKQPEMALDMQKTLDIALRRNYFFIVATTKAGTETLCRCLGIRGWTFICIDHYIDKINSLPLNTSIELRTNDLVKRVHMSEIKFMKLKNSALIIGTLPRTFTQFKDISSKFINAQLVPHVQKSAQLYIANLPLNENKINEYNITWHKNIVTLHSDTLDVPNIVDTRDLSKATHIDYYWSYQTSGKGICGSVLISDMNTSSPLMGIHIAGDVGGGRGYAEVVCRETIENVLQTINDPIVDIEIEGQMFDEVQIELGKDPSKIISALEGDFNFIGTVPRKYAYNPPTRSKNIHSMCFNEITQSTYDQPHLSHKDERFEGSPMVNGCQHHTIPVLDFEDEVFDIAKLVTEEFILAKVRPQRQKIGKLTIEQSVCGIPGILNYDAMEFSTSEGFPFTTIRPKGIHDKRWLFDMTQDEQGYHLHGLESKLTAVMDYKHNLRKQGIVPMTIFTDCLKDLKLPKEKCHKTRIFSISPVDFTIQFRQYFYDFTIAFQNTLLDVESAVGINVDSYQWHDMVQNLVNNSNHFVCGDYSKFGPRLMSKCVLAAFDIIIKWYMYNGDTSEENALVRKIMARETAFSKHLMLNMVYEVVCGAPSGCPITTILNNIVNMLYIRTAYLTLMRENCEDQMLNITSLSSFVENVCVFFYGDDLIMTVKENILHKFNASTLSSFFERYDIKFTDALKTGNIQLSTNVFAKETSFLKRNIKRHPFRPCYVAAMDTRAIEETCNWIFEGHEEPEASIIACESMLLNAFGHGPDYYNSLRDKVILYWRNLNIYPRIPLWIEVDWRIYEGTSY